VAINDVIRQVVDLFDYALKRAKITVVLELPSDSPPSGVTRIASTSSPPT
jgi:hypothetical protein